MTLHDAKRELAKLGITMTTRPAIGEYRVNVAGGKETTAYYATDFDDAYQTGLQMHVALGGKGLQQ